MERREEEVLAGAVISCLLNEESTDLLIESRSEVESLGENMRPEGYELFTIRFILESVWRNFPDGSLCELFDTCIERGGDDVRKVKDVLWYIMVALKVSACKNPNRLCRFVKDNPFQIKEPRILYRILLVEVALEIASNTKTCITFIQSVVTEARVPDRVNYLPKDKNVSEPNDMMPYLLKLFLKLEQQAKIGPYCLEPLKRWLTKRQLMVAAQMVPKDLIPRRLSCKLDGENYELRSQIDGPSPGHNSPSHLDSYMREPQSDFVVAQPVMRQGGRTVVKQCSEEGKYSPCLENSRHNSLDTEFPKPTLNDITKNLQNTYDMMPLIPDDQWPPVKDHIYVDLALITSNNRPLINDPNSFTRETIRGSVDDIFVQKESIKFDEVFVKSKQREIILIDGRPGSGKSTLIMKVTKDWAAGNILQEFSIFILVILRHLRDVNKLTLKDILGEYFDEITTRVVEDLIREADGKGTCIAFDGLDEYSTKLSSDKNNFVLNVISGRDLKNATIYMTSRPATSNIVRSNYKLDRHIEIIGFTETSKNLFIDKQFGSETVKAQKLKDYLKNSPNIDRMCYLPLHLAMVIFLHEHDSGEGKFLPSSETELYYSFTIQTIYRDIAKKSANPFDLMYEYEIDQFDDLEETEKNIFTKICKLAFDATINQKQVYSTKEVKKVVNSEGLRESNSLGLLVVNRASRARATPTAAYSFIHLTHQEFLAAVHLVYYTSDSDQKKVAEEHAHKEYMWVTWKFFCGLYATKEEDNGSKSVLQSVFNVIAEANLSSGLASLNMIHCAHESRHSVLCSSLLTKLDGVVNVKDIKLHPSDCFSISSVLVNSPEDARELDFSYCHFGPAGIQALVQPFKEKEDKEKEDKKKKSSTIFQAIHTLRLRARVDDQPIGYEGYQDLIQLVKRLPNLIELRLYGNRLTVHGFGHLSTTIATLNKLQILILSRNHLDASAGVLLCIMLRKLPELRQFYISYNNLTNAGLREMTPGLVTCKKLEILGLRGIGLDEGAGDNLAEILKELPSLNLLELYQNRLGNLGLKRIIPGLEQAESLETISLVNNGINLQPSDADITHRLAECIMTTTTLKTLRLFYNSFAQVAQVELRTAAVSRIPELGLAL